MDSLVAILLVLCALWISSTLASINSRLTRQIDILSDIARHLEDIRSSEQAIFSEVQVLRRKTPKRVITDPVLDSYEEID